MDSDRLNTLLNYHKNDPQDSFILFALAKEYETLDQLDLALKYYLKLYKNDPEYIGLYYHLAKLYEMLEEDIRALETYNDGIELAKKQKDFHALSELNNAKINLELEMGN